MSGAAAAFETPEAGSPVRVWLAALAGAFSVMRAPLFMSAVVILVLWLPQQMWEVYRVLAQYTVDTGAMAPSGLQKWQFILAAASIFALSIVLWQVARELAHEAAAERPELERMAAPRLVLDWVPRFLALVPFAGVALGLWYSWFPSSIRQDKEALPGYLQEVFADAATLQGRLEYGVYAAIGAGIAVFLVITVFERGFLQVKSGRPLSETKGRRFFFVANWFLFPLLGAASIVAFAMSPVVLPQIFGVIPIFALWAVILTVVGAAGTRFADKFGVPLILIAIVAAAIFELLGLSDNHKFRQLEGTAARPYADQAIKDWLLSRKDLAAYKEAKKPYPVYIVAAEGGGMFAAYHAAKILARMQDLCKNFAQHVFAASGISGGALGASIFAALAEKYAENGEPVPCRETFDAKGPFEQKTEQLLSGDYLSPLIWALLFPDFVQRFLPVPIYALDRARSLEQSFEHAWDQAEGGDRNPFKESLFKLCTAGTVRCSNGAVAPAVLFNTTNVETGAQMVLSPMYFGATNYVLGSPFPGQQVPAVVATLPIEDLNRHSAELPNISLSTAVGLSARFPWLSPAGWYEITLESNIGEEQEAKPQKRRLSFVDGGYFEGSGVATAERLAEYFGTVVKLNKEALGGVDVEIKIIMITESYKPVDHFFQTEPKRSAPGELTVPLAALLQAWRARSSALPTEVEFEHSAGGRLTASAAAFNNDFLPLPLGWQLADVSRKYLDIYTGKPQDCLATDKDLASALDGAVRESSCLVYNVILGLNPAADDEGAPGGSVPPAAAPNEVPAAPAEATGTAPAAP